MRLRPSPPLLHPGALRLARAAGKRRRRARDRRCREGRMSHGDPIEEDHASVPMRLARLWTRVL